MNYEECVTCGNTGWTIDVPRSEYAFDGDAIPVTNEPCPDCPLGKLSKGMLRAREAVKA